MADRNTWVRTIFLLESINNPAVAIDQQPGSVHDVGENQAVALIGVDPKLYEEATPIADAADDFGDDAVLTVLGHQP